MKKLYLASLSRRKDVIIKLSHMLVAMMTVCGRLSNDLNQGLFKIVEWSFTLLEKRDRKKIISEFWKEIRERLEEEDIREDFLVQLGVVVGGMAPQKRRKQQDKQKSDNSPKITN